MAARLVYLAAYQRGFLLDQSKARVQRQMVLPAKRGKILDRNGRLLAMSKPVNDLWASPKLLLAEVGASTAVAKALGMNHQQLLEKLEKNKQRDFFYLARNIDESLGREITAMNFQSVNAIQSYARFYPGGKASAQSVGVVNIDGAGIEGIEYLYDQALAGESGYAKYLINPFGETIESIQRKEPTPGSDVQLTLDRSIQYIAYEALREGVKKTDAKSGVAVVLEVATGNIIAATNYPSYNPDQVNKSARQTKNMRNKVFTDLYEPGSTFKPIALAYVLENKSIGAKQTIQTQPGEFKIGTNIIKDVRNYGRVTVDEVLIKSSNIGMSKLVLSTQKTLVPWLKDRFQVSQKSPRIFPGEPTSTIIDKPKISDFELATISFGYGLSITPIHLAQMYMALANGGYFRPVSLVAESSTMPSEGPKRILKQTTTARINSMLQKATVGHGTAWRANVSGMKVAGKTGTTHFYENGVYHDDRYIASFAGFAPYENPRYVVVVIVEEPSKQYHFGGQAAAPIFSKIMFKSQFISSSEDKIW